MKKFSATDNKLKWALVITGLFCFTACIGISFHELWRDEIQAWSIAVNSHSISDLFYNSRYEGHPKLWFLFLFLLTRISQDIFYMQLLHVFISMSGVFALVYYSPFSFIKNLLICFGYFFAYEYSIISRNYSIECLLLFLSAGLFIHYGQRKLILISCLFFLLVQTNIYAVIVGVLFYAYIIYSLRDSVKKKPALLLCSLGIFLTGIIISIITTVPPADTGFASPWSTELNPKHAAHVMNTVFTSYFPVPLLQRQFWNTNILDSLPGNTIIKFFLSLIILIAAGVLFKKNKFILLLYYSGTLALLLFTYTKYFGYSRHHGHLYLLFVLCCFLYFADRTISNISTPGKISFVEKYFLSFILIVQCLSFIISFAKDIKYPFSNSEDAAGFVNPYIKNGTVITGDIDAPVSAIAGLLQRDIYYPTAGRSGKYIMWDSARKLKSEEEIISEVNKVSATIDKDVLAIFSYRLSKQPVNWILLNSFDGAIVYDENYFIYKIPSESNTSND